MNIKQETEQKRYNVNFNLQSETEHLNYEFSKVTKGLRDNTRDWTVKGKKKGTELYEWQVSYCYMMKELIQAPVYIAPKFADNIRRFISDIQTTRTTVENK